jgi:hypothetical protein
MPAGCLALLTNWLLFRKAEAVATNESNEINFHTLCQDVYLCFVSGWLRQKKLNIIFLGGNVIT